MQKKLLLKLLTIMGLSLLLLVPLSMIETQISARAERQVEVAQNIAESAAGRQTLVGPVLAVRYRERIEHRVKEGDKGVETTRNEIVERVKIFPPETLDIQGNANVESRKRGLYSARLFHLDLTLTGKARIAPRLGFSPTRDIVDAQAFLVLGVRDPRGIRNDPEVRINQREQRFLTGTSGFLGDTGVHLPLGAVDLNAGASFDFSFPLQLTGSEYLAIAPAGNATTVSLQSDWPHPSFQGRFLPVTRTVDARGFSARWQISHLARNFERVLQAHENASEVLSLSFIEPVNVYLKSERAVKYGVLFVVLTFGAFFIIEILRRLPIHPLQYFLVGLALAIFFLLLIALSEHMDFVWAYGLAASACVLLIGTYLAGVFNGFKRGAMFGTGIAGLYGVLYGVLLSEDNALLMGSFLLFAALGAIMLATRRLDWYRIGTVGDEAQS